MYSLVSRVVKRRETIRDLNFEDRVLNMRRVSKTLKGGRSMSISTFFVIGNKKGFFGLGSGNAQNYGDAKKKAVNFAKNNLFFVCTTKSKSIPHDVDSKYKSTRVIIKPAPVGTGIISCGTGYSICKCIGIENIVIKVIGSTNPINVALAIKKAFIKVKRRQYYDSISAS